MDRRLFGLTILAVPAAVAGIKLVPTRQETILAKIRLLVTKAMDTMRTQLDRDMFFNMEKLEQIPYHERVALKSGRWY